MTISKKVNTYLLIAAFLRVGSKMTGRFKANGTMLTELYM